VKRKGRRKKTRKEERTPIVLFVCLFESQITKIKSHTKRTRKSRIWIKTADKEDQKGKRRKKEEEENTTQKDSK